MIPRRKHNASSGSLPPPDDKHASNDYIREYCLNSLVTKITAIDLHYMKTIRNLRVKIYTRDLSVGH